MNIKVIREFNTGDLDMIIIEWEGRRRAWRTAEVMWSAIDIPPFSEQELECWNYSYNESKTFHSDHIDIARTWSFILEQGIINARETIKR